MLVNCPRFISVRGDYEEATGRRLEDPEQLVQGMLQSNANWTAASRLAAAVMGELQRLENEERRTRGVLPVTPQ